MAISDIPMPVTMDALYYKDCLLEMLADIFGQTAVVKEMIYNDRLNMEIDGKKAWIDLRTLVSLEP